MKELRLGRHIASLVSTDPITYLFTYFLIPTRRYVFMDFIERRREEEGGELIPMLQIHNSSHLLDICS